MSSSPADQHIRAVRQHLMRLNRSAAAARGADAAIRKAALHRRAAVAADLLTVQSRVNLSPEAAQQYMDLTLEAGQLDLVLAHGTPDDVAAPQVVTRKTQE